MSNIENNEHSYCVLPIKKTEVEKTQKIIKEVIFIKSNEIKEAENLLTPEMQCISNYVTNQTYEGRFLSVLKKNPNILFEKEELMRNSRTIKKLKELGIIKTEIEKNGKKKKEVTTIHEINPENQIKIWGDSHGPKILKLFEENTRLSASDIKKVLQAAHGFAITELAKLNKSGFLDMNTTKGERGGPKKIYFLSEQLKNKI